MICEHQVFELHSDATDCLIGGTIFCHEWDCAAGFAGPLGLNGVGLNREYYFCGAMPGIELT